MSSRYPQTVVSAADQSAASLPTRGTLAGPAGPARHKPPSGLLAGMRIRKKLIFLHTLFSLALAAILALALRPSARAVILQAETHQAGTLLAGVLDDPVQADQLALLADRIAERSGPGVSLRVGDERDLGLSASEAALLRSYAAGVGVPKDGPYLRMFGPQRSPVLIAYHPQSERFVAATVRLESARAAVIRLYVLATLALLSVYGLVAAALELFVLPRHVYGPIRSMLEADRALEQGRGEDELVPEAAIPADELGEIMRSRNHAVRSLRQHERDLAVAMTKLESAAADLKKKNHLLETARQNLADTGRLAGLGMMSAGLAHEMNTPLAVIKGLSDRLAPGRSAGGLSTEEVELMRRVIARLEGLSEGLLDIARARPLSLQSVRPRELIDEAWTLIRMNRPSADPEFRNLVPTESRVNADPDRLIQVFLNLLRNALDSAAESDAPGSIEISASAVSREGRDWLSIVIADSGTGIDPDILANLFEPFNSSRLDSHGTGLGLAVSEGIVREHGGVLIGRNRTAEDSARIIGAEFEILLPADGGRDDPSGAAPESA